MRATVISRSDISVRPDNAAQVVNPNRLSIVPNNAAFDREKPTPVHLTARQMEVLALLCEGLPNKLICRRLDISAGTVKAHISSILRELGVSSRLQAVVWARRRGLVTDFGHRDEHDSAAAAREARDENQDRRRSVDVTRSGFLN
jgi:DNA-binding NarL/FixJ family response regulator